MWDVRRDLFAQMPWDLRYFYFGEIRILSTKSWLPLCLPVPPLAKIRIYHPSCAWFPSVVGNFRYTLCSFFIHFWEDWSLICVEQKRDVFGTSVATRAGHQRIRYGCPIPSRIIFRFGGSQKLFWKFQCFTHSRGKCSLHGASGIDLDLFLQVMTFCGVFWDPLGWKSPSNSTIWWIFKHCGHANPSWHFFFDLFLAHLIGDRLIPLRSPLWVDRGIWRMWAPLKVERNGTFSPGDPAGLMIFRWWTFTQIFLKGNL